MCCVRLIIQNNYFRILDEQNIFYINIPMYYNSIPSVNKMQPPLPSLSEISPPHSLEWSLIYAKIKKNGNYKSIQTNIENYANKITNLFASEQSQQPSLAIKKTDHRKLLNQIQMSNMKMVDEIAMLNLNDLAASLEYVFQKIKQCLGILFDNLEDVVAKLAAQISFNHSRYVYTSKCTECQNYLMKSKVQNAMYSMTLGNTKKSLQKINNEIDCVGQNRRNHDDADLTIMIDQILQKKQSILGSKNSRINTIYQQIGHYLENMPQTSLNMFKNDSILNATSSQNAEFSGYFNFSQQFEKNMGKMLKNPVKRLIGRIIQQTKSKYCKNTEYCEISTQTYLIKDEENIKILIRSNQTLKKENDNLRKSRRQVEKDLSKYMEAEHTNQIKIKQLTLENQYIRQKIEKTTIQLTTTKQKLQQKQKIAEKTIKDYQHEKSQYLRCIRQYEEKIEVTSSQLSRLRKQTQSNMISQCFGTQQLQSIEVKPHDELSIGSEVQIRNSSNHSRKNIYVKFVRKSIVDYNKQVPTKDQVLQNKQIDYLNSMSSNLKRKNKLHSNNKQDNQKQNGQKIEKKQKIQKTKTRRQVVKHKTQNLVDFNIQQKYGNNLKELERQTKKTFESFKTQPKQEHNGQSQMNLLIEGKNQRPFNYLSMNLRVFQKDKQHKQHNFTNSSFQYLTKNDHQNKSSRMFISKQHCSPYISGHIGNLSSRLFQCENICLDVIGMNKQNKLQNSSQRQEDPEYSQKFSLLSRTMQIYHILKENGNLQKIKKLLQLTQETFNSQNLNELCKEKQKQKKLKTTLPQKKQERQKLRLTRTHQRKLNKVSRNFHSRVVNPVSPIASFTNSKTNLQFEKFTQAELLTLFISKQNAKKYELNIQIWNSLENSIMIDYHFMSLCDIAEVFFQHLKKNMETIYRELSQFLQQPLKYLEKKSLNKQQKGKNTHKSREKSSRICHQIPQKDNHLNEKITPSIELTKSQTPQMTQNKYKEQLNCNQERACRIATPLQLRNIIHKILRFHKIWHKKCNHVQQFLNVIGFDKKSYQQDPLANIEFQ